MPAFSAPHYDYSRPEDLPGVEILHAENCWGLGPVYHATFALCTARPCGGPLQWLQAAQAAADCVAAPTLIAPGEVHEMPRLGWPCDYRLVRIEPYVVADLARPRGQLRDASRDAGDSDELDSALLNYLAAEQSAAPRTQRLARLRALARAIAALQHHSAESSRCSLLRFNLRRARQCVVEQWNCDLNLHALAHEAGMSPFHFLRAFSHEFGLPPHRFQLAVRVEQVRRLLGQGVRAAEIDAGFADQSHLIHCFKRAMGVTPGEYQRMIHAPETAHARAR